jgi:hydroxypyruvate isomerase
LIRRIKIEDAKSFAIINSDDDYWIDRLLESLIIDKGVSFIKIFPPSDATDELIDSIKHYLKYTLGIEVVKIMPRTSLPQVNVEIKNVKRKTIRETVIEYANNVTNSIDKKLLIETLNRTMDQAGL